MLSFNVEIEVHVMYVIHYLVIFLHNLV